MSYVICWMSHFRCLVSYFMCHMSYVGCKMSYVICQMSDLRCQMSDIWCLMSDVDVWCLKRGKYITCGKYITWKEADVIYLLLFLSYARYNILGLGLNKKKFPLMNHPWIFPGCYTYKLWT